MTWERLTLRGKAKGGVQRDAVPPAFDVLRHQPQTRNTAMSLAMHVREDVVSDPAMRYIDTPRLNLIPSLGVCMLAGIRVLRTCFKWTASLAQSGRHIMTTQLLEGFRGEVSSEIFAVTFSQHHPSWL
jgi:hypothetical protein